MTISGVEYFSKEFYPSENYRAFETFYGLRKRPTEKDNDGEEKACDNLFLKLKGYLIFGRIIGVIPISGIFSSKSHTTLSFQIVSLAALISIAISLMLSFRLALSAIGTINHPKSNALEIARSIEGTTYVSSGIFLYVYFLKRAESFIDIFKTWGKSVLNNSVKDKTFNRDITIVSIVVFMSLTCIVTFKQLELFGQFDKYNDQYISPNDTLGKPALQIYYGRSHKLWEFYLGYHPFWACLAYITYTFIVLSWNYTDVLIIILARFLYFKFKSLCQMAVDGLMSRELRIQKSTFTTSDKLFWLNLVKDHDTLCGMLDSLEKFLSPLIFASYATNIYYICMQLVDGLTPGKEQYVLAQSIFAPWSLLHVTLKQLVLSIAAARIHTSAHDIGNILKKCPIELYDEEVARVDKRVTAGPEIGLSGLGCFVITKPFLLSIVNVIFTVEIVLLQGISTSSNGSESCPPKT